MDEQYLIAGIVEDMSADQFEAFCDCIKCDISVEKKRKNRKEEDK